MQTLMQPLMQPLMQSSRRQFFKRAGAGVVLIGAAGTGIAIAQSERTIKVVAKKFEFTPNVIQLKLNQPVGLEFTTADVFMGVNIPDLDARLDIVPGMAQTLRLTPGKVGEFVFVCDVFCGDGHEKMEGKIIVSA